MEVLTDFREFIQKISDKYSMVPNIIAHSFGTYIIGNYLSSFNNEPPIKIQNIILAGSILTENFNWSDCINKGSVSSVYNEMAPNDEWVPHITKTSWLIKDDLFGQAGVKGFNDQHPKIINTNIKAYNHSNVLQEDVFEKIWIPHLNIVKNIDKFDSFEYIKE